MRKHYKITLISFLALLGFIIFSWNANASDAQLLQPAEQTTNFESIRVGVAGQGGVTFFNGSVLNEEGPYVIADDLRVDGSIWRGPSKGTSDGQPLKIADTLMPALTNINDIGTDNYRWRNAYLSGMLNVEGDIRQSRNTNGAVKALVYVNGFDDSCNKQWTFDGSRVDCTSEGDGEYILTFGFDIEDRFWQVTPTRENVGPRAYSVPPGKNTLYVSTQHFDGTGPENSDFNLTIY